MGSTKLGYTRDALYSQWQRDVSEERKQRRGDIAAKNAAELEQIEATNAGAMERLQREVAAQESVAKMRIGGERELQQMRLASDEGMLNRRIASEEGMLATRESGLKDRLEYEERPGGYKDRMAEGYLASTGAKAEKMVGYTTDELADFLHAATHDKDGKSIPITEGDLASLNMMAKQSGYNVKRKPGRAATIINPKFWTQPARSKGSTRHKAGDIVTPRNLDWWINSQTLIPGTESYYLEEDPDAVATQRVRRPITGR